MCLAIPGQIEKVKDLRAVVALGGNRTEVMLELVPDAKVGEWVLVHAGVAITTIDADEARKTYDLLREMSL